MLRPIKITMVIDSAIPSSQPMNYMIAITLTTMPAIENKENIERIMLCVVASRTIRPKIREMNMPCNAFVTKALSVIIQAIFYIKNILIYLTILYMNNTPVEASCLFGVVHA